MPETTPFSPDDLGATLRDALSFLAPTGWGRPPTVFALVPTPVLAELHPGLVDADDDSALSPVAEEPLITPPGAEPYAALEEFLATASWQPPVAGVAVLLDIVVIPPAARADLPADDAVGMPASDVRSAALRSAAHNHPDGRRARLAVGALRDGPRLALLEVEPRDADDTRELRTHPDLAADLAEALAAALTD